MDSFTFLLLVIGLLVVCDLGGHAPRGDGDCDCDN